MTCEIYIQIATGVLNVFVHHEGKFVWIFAVYNWSTTLMGFYVVWELSQSFCARFDSMFLYVLTSPKSVHAYGLSELSPSTFEMN